MEGYTASKNKVVQLFITWIVKTRKQTVSFYPSRRRKPVANIIYNSKTQNKSNSSFDLKMPLKSSFIVSLINRHKLILGATFFIYLFILSTGSSAIILMITWKFFPRYFFVDLKWHNTKLKIIVHLIGYVKEYFNRKHALILY